MSIRYLILLFALLAAACTELPRSLYQSGDDGGLGGDGDSSAGDASSDGHACPSEAALLAHNLHRLNQLRAGRRGQQLVALKADPCLEEIAWRALDEWSAGGAPHGMFERRCLPKVPECECYWEQENIGWAEGETWKQAIDKILGLMMAEEFYDGGHFRNIISSRWTIVGIAIECKVEDGTLAIQLTNEFGP